MTKQELSMVALEKRGFKFSNWIEDRTPGAYGNEPQQSALMVKKDRHGHQYREVDTDGSIH